MATWFCASDKYAAVTPWAASATLAAGSIRRQVSPATGNERCFRTAAGGTTGTTEPAWVLTKGNATTPADGTVTDWTEVTGSSLYNTTASWLAPHARLRNAAPWMAAGDTLYVGNHHAATEAANVTVAFPGTLIAPCYAYSVDDTNATPTILAGASDVCTAGTNITHVINGSVYAVGLTLLSSYGTALYANSQIARQVYVGCTLGHNSSGNSLNLYFGSSGGIRQFFCNNCTFSLPNSGSRLSIVGHLRINGGSLTTGSAVGALFSIAGANGGAMDAVIDGLDCSAAATGFVFVASNGASSLSGQLRVQNCKVPTGWTGTVSNGVNSANRFEMFATANDDSVFQEMVQDFSGSVVQETATFTRTGGAAVPNSKATGVDPQPFAWKFVPTASYCSFPANALKSTPIVIDSLIAGTSAIGSTMTLTAHVLVDSAAEPNDNDIFMEVTSINGAGFTLDSTVSTAPATPLTAAQSLTSKFGGAGSGWNTTGMTNPKMRKLVATFTPNEKGMIFATLCVANAAMTVYADPLIVVS